MRPKAILLLLAATVISCSSSPPLEPANPPPSPPSEPVVMPTVYITPEDAGPIKARFELATGFLLGGDYRRAASEFNRITELEPKGAYAPAAIYHAGFCLEQALDEKGAVSLYRKTAQDYPQALEAKLALLRAVRILTEAEDWQTLVKVADQLLGIANLTPIELASAMAARAHGLIEQGDMESAKGALKQAQDFIARNHDNQAERLPVNVAQIYFAQGEMLRLSGEKKTFSPLPQNLAQALDERCQLLLEAQDAYSTALRSNDAFWAAMASYRMAQLYDVLERDILMISAPKTLRVDRQRKLFEGAARLRYRMLLEKGLQAIEDTVQKTQSTGETPISAVRAQEAKQQLDRALQKTQDALRKLQFKEAELKRTLDDMSKL